MDSSMTMLLDIISLGCGVYCMYTWLRLLVTKRLFKSSLLVPKEKNVEDCVDEAAYIKRLMPSLGVLALTTMLYGAFFIYNDMAEVPLVPYPWGVVPMVVVFAVLFWYGAVNSKAIREYF